MIRYNLKFNTVAMTSKFRLLTFSATCFCLPLFSQVIDSSVVSPANPGINDTIKIYTYLRFSYGGCAGSANFTISGNTISASSVHCLGMLAYICHDVDTVILNPPHTAGNYTYIYTLSSGAAPPPCTPGIIPNDYDTLIFSIGTSNNPPTITNPGNDTICRGNSLGPIAISLSDEDPSSVLLSAYSSDTNILSNSGLLLTGTSSARQLTIDASTAQPGMVQITIKAIDNSSLADSVTFDLVIDPCLTGTERDLKRSGISIYPNPVRDRLFISPEENEYPLTVNIYSMNMKLLMSKQFNSTSSLNLDVSSLPSSVYIIELRNNSDHGLMKFIKMP